MDDVEGKPEDKPDVSKTRRKHVSSESSSSDSDCSSSSDSSKSDSKHKRRYRSKKRGGRKKSRRRLHTLTKQVNELRALVNPDNYYARVDNSDAYSVVSDNVSRELYTEAEPQPGPSQPFVLGLGTKLKEPTIPDATEEQIKLLCEVQRLDNKGWNDIRYSETQKIYSRSPGYTDLEVNEEVKQYDTYPHLVHSDKAYGALTFCLIKQQEALHAAVAEILDYTRAGGEFSYESFREKVSSVLLGGDLFKVSEDMLQLVCGHRAEVINMRRNGITKHIKEPLLKAAIRKIPPSSSSLFNAEEFTAKIEHHGGVRKCFWPLKKTTVSQTDEFKATTGVPSQGTAPHKAPSQGYCNHAHASNTFTCNAHACQENAAAQPYMPQRGNYNHNYPSQGYNSGFKAGPSGSFRGRRSRQYQQKSQNQPRTARKRGASPAGYRYNKRGKY
ncbi:uncharacterized protein LOC134660016 [Cydia amplana]|uniref:uncharacterized protein LOC134660016 n=1 Tax=Cydia amplana TaxID=1869771 RepID=UPI002FE525A0